MGKHQLSIYSIWFRSLALTINLVFCDLMGLNCRPCIKLHLTFSAFIFFMEAHMFFHFSPGHKLFGTYFTTEKSILYKDN